MQVTTENCLSVSALFLYTPSCCVWPKICLVWILYSSFTVCCCCLFFYIVVAPLFFYKKFTNGLNSHIFLLILAFYLIFFPPPFFRYSSQGKEHPGRTTQSQRLCILAGSHGLQLLALAWHPGADYQF